MAIRIGTAERDGTFSSQGRALKVIFERQLGPVTVIESSAASIENANGLHAGALEFGFMASNWIGRAKNGEPPFGQPIDIRMAAPMNAGPLFFITRAQSPIRTVSDLRGKRVVLGMKSSGMVQHAHNIFRVLGLAFTDFTPVYLDFIAGADALAAGDADAQFQCPIPNKVMTDLSERVDVRVLPYAEGDLEKVMAAVSYYRPAIMRKGALRGLDRDMAQPAVVNILATHARMSEPLVHDAVALIVANAAELGQLNALFLGLADLFQPLRREGAGALQFGGVALHPGALRAYREAGLLAQAAPE